MNVATSPASVQLTTLPDLDHGSRGREGTMKKTVLFLAAIFLVLFTCGVSAVVAECDGIEFDEKGKVPRQDVEIPALGSDCVVRIKASTKLTNACLTFDELIDGATDMVVGIGVDVEGDGGGECSAFTSVDDVGSAKVKTRCKHNDAKTKIRFELSECFETPIP